MTVQSIERMRNEIEKFRQKGINEEINQKLIKLENKPNEKIKELEVEIDEVAKEVHGVTGHWIMDKNDNWENEKRVDRRFKTDMFVNLQYHVEDVLKKLNFSVLEELKEIGNQIGENVKPWYGEEGYQNVKIDYNGIFNKNSH